METGTNERISNEHTCGDNQRYYNSTDVGFIFANGVEKIGTGNETNRVAPAR